MVLDTNIQLQTFLIDYITMRESPLSLLLSLSSTSLPSKQLELLLTLSSELALLLVARGESETLTDLLFVPPDLTLYIEEAGMFVIIERRLPELRLISICLIAISRDFFESVLPKPILSGNEDDFPALLFVVLRSSCFGGASFLMLTTLSTICVPISTGFTWSLPLECARLIAGIELLPCGACILEGEHDWRLCLPLEPASTEDDRALGPPGLPLDAEAGLSGIDVLKFGGASSEKPGISVGFHGVDFEVGEFPRDDAGFFVVVGADFFTDDDRPDTLGKLEQFASGRVGVADLDVDLEAGAEGLAVGVEERAVDLVGVEDLNTGAVGLVLEGKLDREVGVEGLEDLVDAVKVGRPVGVAGLQLVDVGPLVVDGFLLPALEKLSP